MSFIPPNSGAFVGGAGQAPFIQTTLDRVFGESNPRKSMRPIGYMAMLLAQSEVTDFTLGEPSGHRRTVKVKSAQRLSEFDVDDSQNFDCFKGTDQPYVTEDVELVASKSVGIPLDSRILNAYEAEYQRSVTANGSSPLTSVSMEMWERINGAANALVSSSSKALFTDAVTKIGTNVRTGNNLATPVNVTLDTTNRNLSAMETDILADFQENEGGNMRPQIVGAGLFHKYAIQNQSVGMNQSGLNTTILAQNFDFFYDPFATTALGTNEILVYQPDAVRLVSFNENRGINAGVHANSTFGTIVVPFSTFGMNGEPIVNGVEFDFQLKAFDCAQDITDPYNGSTYRVNKGWNMIMSLTQGIHTISANAYKDNDVMAGNRGSYRYSVTNT